MGLAVAVLVTVTIDGLVEVVALVVGGGRTVTRVVMPILSVGAFVSDEDGTGTGREAEVLLGGGRIDTTVVIARGGVRLGGNDTAGGGVVASEPGVGSTTTDVTTPCWLVAELGVGGGWDTATPLLE